MKYLFILFFATILMDLGFQSTEAGYNDDIQFQISHHKSTKITAAGPMNAPVQLIVYTDFECPYSAEGHQLLEEIQDEYVGQIRVEVKNFPLSFHERAKPAALASLAAGNQGKYWEYSSLLYANQTQLQKTDLLEYAHKTGLDMELFSKDLADPALERRLSEEIKSAEQLGIAGTPTVFLNGQRFDNLSDANLRFKINDLLGVGFDRENQESMVTDRTTALQKNIAPCSEDKVKDVLANATTSKNSVKIDCHLNLKSSDKVTKRLILEGASARGVNIDCNSATLDGSKGKVNHRKDMIEVRSKKTGAEQWERPSGITIKNCNIIGSVRVWGMGKNGEASAVKKSSKKETTKTTARRHVVRIRRFAPTNIVFDKITITGVGRNLFYLSPGVTKVQLLNSELKGKSDHVAIYLDAESAQNTIKNNYIHTSTGNHVFEKWDRPLIAIDGSSHNKIMNNKFSNLSHGGIYLYRNCGEGGTIRHSSPSHNQIINNIFYYNKYQGGNPAVYLGSRDYGTIERLSYCDDDDGRPYGSSANEQDFAKHNVVMQNQIYKRSVRSMIKTNNPSINSPNYIDHNRTVTKETKGPAGCYLTSTKKLILHARTKEVVTNLTKDNATCTTYRCNDGELIKRPRAGNQCNITKVNFSCRVEGNNKGCHKMATCPAGKDIVGTIAACNLESGTVSSNQLAGVRLHRIKVIKASDKTSSGSCYVGSNKLSSGQKTINRVVGRDKVALGCKEYDKNGGDCHISGVLYCH